MGGVQNRADQRSVATRALAVLEAFTPEHPALSLSEISARASLPLTTTHRLISELSAWGALERNGNSEFRIGLRLWEIASLAHCGRRLREAARPFLQDLYEVTHENVQLAVREGHEVVWIDRLAGRAPVDVLTRVGGRFPLHASGAGLVLLAHAPATVQHEVLAGSLQRFTDDTIIAAVELRRVLDLVRRKGYAISERQVTLDAVSVAAPVLDSGRNVVAALSVVAAAADPACLVPAVRAAALGISRAFSARPSS